MIIRGFTHTLPRLLKMQAYRPTRFFCQQVTTQTEDALKKFKQCLQQNSDSSLEEGAKLLASLEFQVEQNNEYIADLQAELDLCPGDVLQVIKKIQKIKENIELQEEEISSIENRTQKQIQDCKNYSISKIAKEILDVADCLNRAHQHSLKVHNSSDHEVVVSISKATKQMKNLFQRYGIEQFDPLGQKYDPNTQQALANTDAPEGKQKRTVAHTMRTGYKIKGRLLRSAHVAIYS